LQTDKTYTKNEQSTNKKTRQTTFATLAENAKGKGGELFEGKEPG